MTFTIRGPLPTGGLKPHQRLHWTAEAKCIRDARESWRLLALQANPGRVTLDRAKLTYRLQKPSQEWSKTIGKALKTNQKPYCPRDYDNVFAAVKPALDGIVESGLLKDDNRKVIVNTPTVEWVPSDGVGPGYLEIEVTDEF